MVNFLGLLKYQKMVQPSPRVSVQELVLVNVPLQLDVATQFVKPIVVANRNGSKRIRTFAGNDTIYAGNNGGAASVDGGLGTNTVVYSGPSTNYTITPGTGGSWTVKDNVGNDGTDTLVRIQQLYFTDKVMTSN